MLVVIVIIGILAALGAPTLKGLRQANLVASANRQLLDDLSFARIRALSDRTTVYMVFIPTNIVAVLNSPALRPDERRIVSNLVLGQYSTYALLTLRTVGEVGDSDDNYLKMEGICLRADSGGQIYRIEPRADARETRPTLDNERG